LGCSSPASDSEASWSSDSCPLFTVHCLLGLLLEGGGHKRVVLGAQVQLLVAAGPGGRRVALAIGLCQAVLALEAADVRDRHIEPVSDPGVGPALAGPGPDLVQLGFQ